MGSDESHFNVSLIVRDKVTRVSTNHNFWRERRTEAFDPRSFRLPAYRLTARPNRLSNHLHEPNTNYTDPPPPPLPYNIHEPLPPKGQNNITICSTLRAHTQKLGTFTVIIIRLLKGLLVKSVERRFYFRSTDRKILQPKHLHKHASSHSNQYPVPPSPKAHHLAATTPPPPPPTPDSRNPFICSSPPLYPHPPPSQLWQRIPSVTSSKFRRFANGNTEHNSKCQVPVIPPLAFKLCVITRTCLSACAMG